MSEVRSEHKVSFWAPLRNRMQGAMNAYNTKHLSFFKAPRGDDPEQNAGTIHASNLEHLLVLRLYVGQIGTEYGDKSCVQSGTPLHLRLHAGAT